MIFTIKDLLVQLNQIAAQHGDGCLVGIDDADTDWELPVEKVRFDQQTKRVLLNSGGYHGEEWPAADTEESHE